MSLRGKDFRCEIDADLHDKLRRLCELRGIKEVSTLGALLLEKMIVAEWHDASIYADRVERSGIMRNRAERQKDKA